MYRSCPTSDSSILTTPVEPSFALNYKGLNYKTKWVDYPDIEAVCKEIGAPPTGFKADGVTPLYTCPVIYDSSTKAVVSDSTKIAEYLDKAYPDAPMLYPSGTRGLQAAFESAFAAAGFSPMFMLIVNKITFDLPGPSSEYFKRTRTESYGKLDEIAPEGEKREKFWKEFEAGMATVASWIEAGGSKPFLGGTQPVYADLQIAARLIFARNIMGKNSKDWKRVQAMDGGRWDRYMQRFEKWSAVL